MASEKWVLLFVHFTDEEVKTQNLKETLQLTHGEARGLELEVVPLCASGSLPAECFHLWDKCWIVSNAKAQELYPAPANFMAMSLKLYSVIHS